MEIGLTQREVARRAGISQSTLSDIERGEITGRSLEVLASLARIFNVSADYLLDLPAV
jgi:transcriptional regulator with XRE-family HTH domain